MPDRRSARIPKYRLHKPSGLAVVRLNGRDVYLGQHGTEESRQRYEQVIAEWLSNHRLLAERRELPDSPRALSVSELVVAYLEHAEGHYVKNGHPTGEFENIKDAVRPSLPFIPNCLSAKDLAHCLSRPSCVPS